MTEALNSRQVRNTAACGTPIAVSALTGLRLVCHWHPMGEATYDERVQPAGQLLRLLGPHDRAANTACSRTWPDPSLAANDDRAGLRIRGLGLDGKREWNGRKSCAARKRWQSGRNQGDGCFRRRGLRWCDNTNERGDCANNTLRDMLPWKLTGAMPAGRAIGPKTATQSSHAGYPAL